MVCFLPPDFSYCWFRIWLLLQEPWSNLKKLEAAWRSFKALSVTDSSCSGWFELRRPTRDTRPINYLQNFDPEAPWYDLFSRAVWWKEMIFKSQMICCKKHSPNWDWTDNRSTSWRRVILSFCRKVIRMPVSIFSDISYGCRGVYHLQNMWIPEFGPMTVYLLWWQIKLQRLIAIAINL